MLLTHSSDQAFQLPNHENCGFLTLTLALLQTNGSTEAAGNKREKRWKSPTSPPAPQPKPAPHDPAHTGNVFISEYHSDQQIDPWGWQAQPQQDTGSVKSTQQGQKSSPWGLELLICRKSSGSCSGQAGEGRSRAE